MPLISSHQSPSEIIIIIDVVVDLGFTTMSIVILVARVETVRRGDAIALSVESRIDMGKTESHLALDPDA